MIRNLFLISLISAFALTTSAEPREGGTGHGRAVRPGAQHSVFNKYPSRAAPVRGGAVHNNIEHSSIPVHPDAFGNRVTEDHLQRVEFASQRATNTMKLDAHVRNSVAFSSAAFVSTMHPIYQQKTVFINDQFGHYNNVIVEHPVYWQTWHSHAFYGGFYYGFHPVPDINVYFYNPMVHWFYVSSWDPQYYHAWYADEYQANPEIDRPFEYFGVYFPTDNLRQLLFGVSGMPVDKQAHFRSSIIDFTRKLTQQLANASRSHVALSKGDIVITHYEILGYDDAVVVEGFATHQKQAYNFKGMMSLTGQPEEKVFVTSTLEDPSPVDLRNLDDLNHSIDSIRGDVAVASPAPAQPAVPTPSGEVSADPQPQQ